MLVVEDERDVATTLKRVIESCGRHDVRLCIGGDAGAMLRAFRPDLVFTDLMMPGEDGFAMIRRVKDFDPDLPVVVVSAFSTLENAVEAVKLGAFDFLAKPFSPESVDLILAKVERDRQLRERAAEARRQADAQDADLRALLGESAPMRRLREWIVKARGAKANVLIEGESGTGKELVARAIHARKGPYVAVNAAAVPDSLAEAELFGYRKGAFTGAVADRAGLLAEANGGTLFLDEINAMSPGLQAKLLRVLEDRRLRPLGGTGEQALDFRLLSATNRDLERMVEQGEFRRDLYHRIKVLHTRIVPLRERREDIPQLAAHFLQHYARAHGCRARRLSAEALAALTAANWPGNVRELENVIEQAVILCPPGAVEISAAALTGSDKPAPLRRGDGEAKSLAAVEMEHIQAVLASTAGNKAQAARILGIDYKTLLRKLAP
ncbi:MAG: sigma-54-dependent Fis family transcriptional regulator [Betaproteobacteria bacterium CG2_30_68_42]|nr:MAG: sigma-54-dependent Fis family transcriptional regulator [Betaproteobacteria bacterium CG2_30_68_42]